MKLRPEQEIYEEYIKISMILSDRKHPLNSKEMEHWRNCLRWVLRINEVTQ